MNDHEILIDLLKGPITMESISSIVAEYAYEMGRDGNDFWAVIKGGDTLQWCICDGIIEVGGGHCDQMFNPTEFELRRAIEKNIPKRA